ncbi:MAG: ATP synthase F1 subunit delta [Bacteroidetes bacterium]|nr:ATP synthase F1 subunit delta [Bacteroidota bacterium]
MSEIKIANRYAQALIQQATTDNKLSVVAQDIQVLFDTISNSKDLKNVLQNPIINGVQKLDALTSIFKNFNPLSSGLINLVCNKNRENILLDIADAFLNAYRTQQGIQKVTIESAVALDSKTVDSIKQFVKEKTGANEIEVHTSINTTVIGGMIIKYGDNLLDTSIAAKLRNLKKELNIA